MGVVVWHMAQSLPDLQIQLHEAALHVIEVAVRLLPDPYRIFKPFSELGGLEYLLTLMSRCIQKKAGELGEGNDGVRKMPN